MKKAFRLIIFLLFSSVAFGQETKSSQPKTTPTSNDQFVIIDESPINVNPLKYRIDYLFTALNADPKGRGLIINYGTNKDIAKRKAEIVRAIKFRGYDLKRVKFLKRFSKRRIKTELYSIKEDGKAFYIPYPRKTKQKFPKIKIKQWQIKRQKEIKDFDLLFLI